MDRERNGINMIAVKKQNRSAILNLINRSGGMSRKEIARKLNLTPAAITLITTDLINEGILIESNIEQNNYRKGRKEILLEISRSKFSAIGIYISMHKFQILCIDLNQNVIFEETVFTADCHKKSGAILDKVCSILNTNLVNYDVSRTKTLLGVGVSVIGVVNTREGVSVNSYNLWEPNVNVVAYLQEKLKMPVILTNNICSLAHGENFYSHLAHPDNMLFIKYGPGVGAARLSYQNALSVHDFNAIQLGHLISDPNGAICECGNQGCLETVVGYDAIIHNAAELMSERLTPSLYAITGGNPDNVTMQLVIKAYDEDDTAIDNIFNRVAHYLSIAIKNAMCLFDPKSVVLYGELFENAKFRKCLHLKLSQYSGFEKVNFSRFSLQLETLGPASTAIGHFMENGGVIEY